MEEPGSRYSLLAGEGDGSILGMAAGDTAGGAWELGYSASTEQATVIAYELIKSEHLDVDTVLTALREMDGSDREEPVYRAESIQFRTWLDRAAAGSQVPEQEISLDPAPRAVPIGVAFRSQPEQMVREVIALESQFHSHTLSLLSGVAVAAATAASCFGQSGRDLVAGVSESIGMAVGLLESRSDLTGRERLGDAEGEIFDLVELVGVTDGGEALEEMDRAGSTDPWDLLRAGLLVAAPTVDRPHLPLEQAARIGGSTLGAAIGGVVGARVGIRAWPWLFANDTWFAEVGRRLVRGPREVGDLPIPYAVEQHLISGERRGIH